MTFSIDGTPIHWPDGTLGEISQEHFDPESDRHAFVVHLWIKHQGNFIGRGTLRFTDEAHLGLPGATDAEKARAVGALLAERILSLDLTKDFALGVGVDDVSGVYFFEHGN
jgi:hypothetical protein